MRNGSANYRPSLNHSKEANVEQSDSRKDGNFYYHHYRINKNKIWYEYSSNDAPQIDSIRFMCNTPDETINVIKSFNGNGWITTTFFIEYKGEDGVITDYRFIDFAI